MVDKEGYCRDCNPKEGERVLAKQKEVIGWLSSDSLTSSFSSIDRVLPETRKWRGSRYHRPDIAYKIQEKGKEDHHVIVEIDERQHNTDIYRTCDIPRMINLHSDLMRPVYFIRYNPDTFRTNEKIIKISAAKRKKILIQWIKWTINYAKENKVEDGLHVLYLFYDGYQDGKEKWTTIDPFSDYE